MVTAKRPPGGKPDVPPASRVRPAIDPAEVFCEALPSILKMARNRGFDGQAQRDVAQDVGEILTEQQHRYDPDRGTPVQWAIGITVNVIRHARRRQSTERRFIEQEPSGNLDDRPALDLTPEERARAREALALIAGALSEEEREIFELKAEQHTAEQIGVILGLTQSKVEQRIREARERLAALLKRRGEDEASATQVRAAVLPFLTVEDVEAALRAGKVWEGVAGEVARVTARVALSKGQLGAGAAGFFVAGAVIGIAVLFALTGAPRESPPSIHAETVPVVATAPAATATADTGRTTALVPATTARAAAPASTATAPVDPDTATESVLLQTAANAAPPLALALADKHEKRFRGESFEKRELIRFHAHLALGRRDDAERHARALDGTVYEKALQDALKRSSR